MHYNYKTVSDFFIGDGERKNTAIEFKDMYKSR